MAETHAGGWTARRREHCRAELGGSMYWCVIHDREWPSGWTECKARRPVRQAITSSGGSPAQSGTTGTATHDPSPVGMEAPAARLANPDTGS